MAICGACGTANGDKARSCMGCAKALSPPDEGAAAAAAQVVSAPAQTCPACQMVNPLAATRCKSCRGSLVPDLARPAASLKSPASGGMAAKAVAGLALGVVAVSVALWWLGLKEGVGNPPAQASAPALAQAGSPEPHPLPEGAALALSATPEPAQPQAKDVAAQTGLSPQEMAASEDARIKRQAAVQARRAARERAAADEQARATKLQEPQRAEEAARQTAAAQAAQLARAAKATPPPPPAPVAQTVEQTCASSGNFFSREVCRLRSCSHAVFASDPVCVRFREMEAANRQAAPN